MSPAKLPCFPQHLTAKSPAPSLRKYYAGKWVREIEKKREREG